MLSILPQVHSRTPTQFRSRIWMRIAIGNRTMRGLHVLYEKISGCISFNSVQCFSFFYALLGARAGESLGIWEVKEEGGERIGI